MFSKLSFFLNSDLFQNSGFFLNSDFFSNSGFFLKTKFLIVSEQCASHISADHDCWLKENEQNGVNDQNGCYLFYASCPIG